MIDQLTIFSIRDIDYYEHLFEYEFQKNVYNNTDKVILFRQKNSNVGGYSGPMSDLAFADYAVVCPNLSNKYIKTYILFPVNTHTNLDIMDWCVKHNIFYQELRVIKFRYNDPRKTTTIMCCFQNKNDALQFKLMFGDRIHVDHK